MRYVRKFRQISLVKRIILSQWLNENFRKEFKQILPCLFVNISTHRELKNPKTFLNSLTRKKNEENLIRNGEKTQAETTFLQPNHDNVMISIETDLNGDANHNGTKNDGAKAMPDGNNLTVRCSDEAVSSSTSRTQDTSIS